MRNGRVLFRRLEQLEATIRNANTSDPYHLHSIAMDYLAPLDRVAIGRAAGDWYGAPPPYEVSPELEKVFGRWAEMVDQLRNGECPPCDSIPAL